MKRLFIIYFILSVLLCFNKAVLGADLDRESLTVEDAVEKAVKYSKTIKNLSENSEITDENIKSITSNLISSNEPAQIVNFAIQLKEARNTIENNKLNAEAEKQNIELSVISFFASVLNAERNIELFEDEIAIAEKELKADEVKTNLGLLSKNDFENQKIEYNKKLKERDSLQISIDEAYVSLNKVLGNELDKKYNLVLDIEYRELGNVGLDYAVLRAVDSNISVSEKKSAVEIAKYGLDSYTSMTDNNTKLTKQNSYNSSVRSLEDEKISIKEKVINTYNSIIKLENAYKTNLSELENMKKQLDIKEIQLNLGKITPIELENYKYSIKKLEADIQNQIYNHEILLRRFENSNLQ